MTQPLNYHPRARRPEVTKADVAFWVLGATLLVLLMTLVWAAIPKVSSTRSPWHVGASWSLLGQIELYNLQHGAPIDFEEYPNGEQLFSSTMSDGSLTQAGPGVLGPYIMGRAINQVNGRTNFVVVKGPLKSPSATTRPAGWIYYPDAKRVVAVGVDANYKPPVLSYWQKGRRQLGFHYSGRGWFRGTVSIATWRDVEDPLWLLAIPLGLPIAANSTGLWLVRRWRRRIRIAKPPATEGTVVSQ